MTTEDRDIESANPSKNLKVGEFDRLSGFFTPVWESNRRVRQPTGANGVESAQDESSAALSAAPDAGTARSPGTSAASPAQPLTRNSVDANRAVAASKSNGVVTPAPAAAAPALSDGPSRVATALKHAGPNPPSEAFMDSEPEFRAPLPARPAPSPPRAERPAAHFRSLVASAAATAVHERLKAKLSDELPIPESRSALDSFSEELRARATPEAMTGNDPYPPQLLRRLRRTLRLSTPLPEPVRAMLAKYARN